MEDTQIRRIKYLTDLGRLEKYIEESGIRREKLAQFIGITRASLWNKLNGITEFCASEIRALAYWLRLDTHAVITTFFGEHEQAQAEVGEVVACRLQYME